MSQRVQAWLKRLVVNRIPVALSISVASLALVASATAAPSSGQGIGGKFAFGSPDVQGAAAAGEVFIATPNPIQVCNSSGRGNTELSWNIGRSVQYEVRRDSESGVILKRGSGSSRFAARGAENNTKFYLITYRSQRVREGNRMVTSQVRDAVVPLTVTHTTNGCTQAEPPRVTCNPNPQAAQVGQQVTFTAVGGVGNFTWSSVGAIPPTASGANYTMSYAAAGSKTVTVASGNQTATCQVTVTAATPAASAALSCTPGTQSVGVGQPATVTTNATGTANVTYTWSAIGASSSIRSGNSLIVTYTTPGNKTVTVDNYTTTASCTIVVTQGQAAPAPTVSARPGHLVSMNNTTYLVASTGVYGVPNVEVFNSWCFKASEVLPANSAESSLRQLGLLQIRSVGQTVPYGIDLKVSTCAPDQPQAPAALSCSPQSPTVEAGKPVKFTAVGGDGESTYRWTAMDAAPVINFVFTPSITPSFQSYSDGLTPYEYNAAVVVYSGTKTAQCAVKVTTAPAPAQPVALDPNASCDSNSYIRPLNIIPNVAGDTTANAKKLIDGDQNTVWSGPNNSSGYWITLDLGEQFKISKLCLKPQLTGSGTYVRYGISVYDDYANSNNYDGFSEHHFPSITSAPGAWVGLQTSGLGRFVRVYFSAPTILSAGATTVPALAFSELKLVGAAKNGAYQVPIAEPVVPEVMYICSSNGGAGADSFQYTARGAGESTLSSTAEKYQGVAIRSGLISIQLGAGNTQNTYTFIHGGVTKTMRTLPEPGPCAKTTKLSLSIPSNGVPLCPTQNQYTQIQAVGQVEHAPAGYVLKSTDKVTGIYVNTMTGQSEVLPDVALKTTVNLNTFVFTGLPYTIKGPGYVIYTLIFNDQVLSKQYSAGWASNFCIPSGNYQ